MHERALFIFGEKMITKTAEEIFDILKKTIIGKPGKIVFTLGETSVTIDTTDTVGNSIQSWLKQWMINNDFYHAEPVNTQEFPDFFLSEEDRNGHMLEVKAFNYNATPAFDIANYESYVSSVAEKPYRLFADYLVFGYSMDAEGTITIKEIWLKKIWELAGTSKRFPLNTQVKRDVIYNIRPNSRFKYGQPSFFNTKEEFLCAIYGTQSLYRGKEKADEWKAKLIHNYSDYFGEKLSF